MKNSLRINGNKKMAAILVCDDSFKIDDFSKFIKTFIKNQNNLLEVIKNLMHRYDENLKDFILLLIPYIDKFNLSKSLILKQSHAFCKNCVFYKPSHLCNWINENKELFETEIKFFNEFFSLIPNIKKDVPFFKLKEFFKTDVPLIHEQTDKEKLKILNSLVVNFKHLNV